MNNPQENKRRKATLNIHLHFSLIKKVRILNKIKPFPLNKVGIKIIPNSNNRTRKDHDQLMMNIALLFVCRISVHAQRDNLEGGRTIRGAQGNTKAPEAELQEKIAGNSKRP